MTDRNKFEEMLERLINEDREGAEELFHEIVVEKSREIYQNIIESEDEEVDEAEDEEVDEAEEDELEESADEEVDEAEEDDLDEAEEDDLDEAEDDDIDEMFGLDEFEVEANPMMGGDATDDMMGDMGGDTDAMSGMEGGEGEPVTKADLEDAIQQLMAEFQAMLDGDEGEDEEGEDEEGGEMPDFGGEEGEEDDEEGEEEPEKEAYAFEAKKDMKKDDKKAKKSSAEEMREYVEKVAPAKMGDNGTNTKSIVASKNDMGGTTANILRADTENSGEANKGHLKGSSLFKGTPKEDNAGNINVPGGKAGKTSFKKSEPGHGAEKKGKPETADKGAGSTIKGVVRKK